MLIDNLCLLKREWNRELLTRNPSILKAVFRVFYFKFILILIAVFFIVSSQSLFNYKPCAELIFFVHYEGLMQNTRAITDQ